VKRRFLWTRGRCDWEFSGTALHRATWGLDIGRSLTQQEKDRELNSKLNPDEQAYEREVAGLQSLPLFWKSPDL